MAQSHTTNVELGIAEAYRDGYPALASWIARDPDDETFVFRKFSYLAARNLLYLQCELVELEAKLRDFDRETLKSDDMESKQAVRVWEQFVHGAAARDTERDRMVLVMDIRAKLKEYHEALLLQRQVSRLDQPSHRVLRIFRAWLYGPGESDHVIGGKSKRYLDDVNDLVALRAPENQDLLSRILQDHWPFPIKAPEGYNPRDTTRHFSEAQLGRVVATVDVVVATILLIGPITSLYFVTGQGARLGMIAAFTVFFAMTVGLLTSARRAEIFGATAAYAAVLVVFVSGNLAAG